MGLLNVYDTISNKNTTIKATGKLKDILPDVDFSHSLVLKAGNRINGDYEVTDEDVLYIRKVPGSTVALAVISIVIAVIAIGVGVGTSIYANKKSEQAQKEMEKAQRDANNLAQQTQQLPYIRGAKNRKALGESVQFVMGSVYNTPYNLTDGFFRLSGNESNQRVFYCSSFSCGYNSQKITKVLLGNETLCQNEQGLNGSIAINRTSPYYNVFSGVEVRQPGEQFSYESFNRKYSSTYLGAELKHDYGQDSVPIIVQAAENTCAIGLCICFSALRQYDANTETWGDRIVRVRPFWSNDGGETWNEIEIQGAATFFGQKNFIVGNKNYTYRYTANYNFSPEECYGKQILIKVERVTPKTENGAAQDDCSLEWYQSVCYDPQLSTANNIVMCNSVQPELLYKTTRVAYRIPATDDTNSILDELHCITEGQARTWDGTEWSVTKEPTRNPAAWLLEVLTSDVHEPSKISETQINLASFGALYEYCTTEQFYCDGIITKSEKKKDVIEKILKICNSTLIINNEGLYEVCIDKEEENPVALLNTENIVSFSFSKSLAKKVDGTRVTFTNRESWTIDTFYSMLDGGSYDYTTDTIDSLAIDYVTDAKHAYKVAQRQLRQRQLQPREIKVDVGHEGDYYPLYSKVLLQLPHLLQGLRSSVIKSLKYDSNGAISKVEISDLVDFIDNTRYGIIIQATNSYGHKMYSAEVTNTELTDSTRILTLAEPLDLSEETIIPEKGNHLSFGTLDNNGQFSKITNTMKIYGVEPNGKDGFTLTLRDYNEEVYKYTPEGVPIPEHVSNISIPQEKSKAVTLEALNELKNQMNKGFSSILLKPDNTPLPSNVTNLTAYASETGITLNWDPIQTIGLQNTLKHYVIELSKNNKETWISLLPSATNHYFYTFTRTGTEADEYPEADDFDTWYFRVKAKSIYDETSEVWAETTEINTDEYGTWKIPPISIIKEVVDRTVILTAAYKEINRKLYGKNQLKVWIKRNGNTDAQGSQSFNQILHVTPDDTWYTPEFNESVMGSETVNTEKNYHKFDQSGTALTDAFETSNFKISHTLPLMGQCPRLYKGTDYVGITADVLNANVPSIRTVTTIPVSSDENAIVLYDGTTTETYTNGKYYIYAKNEQEQLEWQEVETGFIIKFIGTTSSEYKKDFYYELETVSSELVWTELTKGNPTIVPTEYVYKITVFNESCETYPQNAREASDTYVQALCTNIADIVHSHEHYKDLYVEKLSAISANIGMISQGGMGDFNPNTGNYWALSDLYPEDSGFANLIRKGAFRVGGTDQYFKVTPDPNDPDKFDIELKAGNITLTSQGDGTSFTAGTYIFDSNDPNKRLALTPTGIIAQEYRNIGTTQNPIWEWVNISKVMIDAKGNMVITNSDNPPAYGLQREGTIYHFDNHEHPEYEEVADNESPSNPEGIICTGTVVPTDNDSDKLNCILYADSSPNCIKGTVQKNISTDSFEGDIVFFSKAEKIVIYDTAIDVEGNFERNIPDLLTGYNEAMRETSTEEPNKTVGEYLGLSQAQINKGIFY